MPNYLQWRTPSSQRSVRFFLKIDFLAWKTENFLSTWAAPEKTHASLLHNRRGVLYRPLTVPHTFPSGRTTRFQSLLDLRFLGIDSKLCLIFSFNDFNFSGASARKNRSRCTLMNAEKSVCSRIAHFCGLTGGNWSPASFVEYRS